MNYKVKMTIRRMGRNCQSCKQEYECVVDALDELEAVAKAK